MRTLRPRAAFRMARLRPSDVDCVSVLKETVMTRNHLLILSMKPRPPAQGGVWRMTLHVLGQAFGVLAVGPERRR